MSVYLKFLIDPSKLLTLCDANWGAQDQSIPNPKTKQELLPFVSRSISGFIIFQNGPIHLVSKRQTITARSSAESEIYATDECVKNLLRLTHIINDLDCSHIYTPTNSPIQVFNDNNACVCWSKSSTTKGLRHISILDNAIRESVANKTISIQHIDGKINFADIFTKEVKDNMSFITMRDQITCIAPNPVLLMHSSG